MLAAIDTLMGSVFSQKPVLLTGEKLQAELNGVAELYYEQKRLVAALNTLSDSYPRS